MMPRHAIVTAAALVLYGLNPAWAQDEDGDERQPVTELAELESMLGNWVAEDVPLPEAVPDVGEAGDAVDMRDRTRYVLGRKAIITDGFFVVDGRRVHNGHTVWKKDAITGNVKVWHFDHQGNLFAGDCFKEGNAFIVAYSGELKAETEEQRQLLGEGIAQVEGEAVMTMEDENTNTFTMQNMKLNGQPVPFPPPPAVTMKRVEE